MRMSDSTQKKTLSLKKTSDQSSEPSKRSQTENPQAKKPVRRGKAALRDRSKVPEQYRVKKDNTEKQAKQTPATPQASEPDRRTNSPTKDTRQTIKQSSQRQAPTRGGKLRDGFDPERPRNSKRKTPMAQENANPRLSKVMADRGLCSRREADAWIENGWVKVDGNIVDVLGTRISRDAEITVHQQAQNAQAESVTFLLHKPIGYVSGQPEDGYEPAVALITAENEWAESNQIPENLKPAFRKHMLKGLAPAGRLDIDSTGLLVMTQDGRVARKLIGENSSVEKEYLVRVEGEIIPNGLAFLNFGLRLDDQPLKRAKVSWQNEDQLRFVLKEGKKRQIRRMCELVGLKVVGLKRIRIGQIPLSKLPVGQWRFLGPNERF